jgi:glycosyltransferase involved in cell wall biosynthesis
LARQAGDRVVFVGYWTGTELARVYASADLLVFPSLTETFGNVVLEGMASGLPVLAFNVPGPGDTVRHGTTGILVDEISSAALALALDHCLQNPGLRQRLGEAARRYAVEQNWDRVNAVVRTAYVQASTRPATPPTPVGQRRRPWISRAGSA